MDKTFLQAMNVSLKFVTKVLFLNNSDGIVYIFSQPEKVEENVVTLELFCRY